MNVSRGQRSKRTHAEGAKVLGVVCEMSSRLPTPNVALCLGLRRRIVVRVGLVRRSGTRPSDGRPLLSDPARRSIRRRGGRSPAVNRSPYRARLSCCLYRSEGGFCLLFPDFSELI